MQYDVLPSLAGRQQRAKAQPATPPAAAATPAPARSGHRHQRVVWPDVPVPQNAKVRVNHFFGRVLEVQTHLWVPDPVVPGQQVCIALRQPLYTVRVDTSRRVGWVVDALQVYVPEGNPVLKLFPDEFEVVQEW